MSAGTPITRPKNSGVTVVPSLMENQTHCGRAGSRSDWLGLSIVTDREQKSPSDCETVKL